MQMHMLVERRAKPVLERDRAQPRVGLSCYNTFSWYSRRIANAAV